MTAPDPRYFALWTGRRGLVNTLACFALALPCALALRVYTEHTTAAPACRAYGQAHGLRYVDVVHHAGRDEPTTVCQYALPNGEASEVNFQTFAPFLTDLGVGFGLDLKFTLPAFAVLLAALRTWVFVGAESRRGKP